MVPEISLTPQFVSQFAKRFGDKIAVFTVRFHSVKDLMSTKE